MPATLCYSLSHLNCYMQISGWKQSIWLVRRAARHHSWLILHWLRYNACSCCFTGWAYRRKILDCGIVILYGRIFAGDTDDRWIGRGARPNCAANLNGHLSGWPFPGRVDHSVGLGAGKRAGFIGIAGLLWIAGKFVAPDRNNAQLKGIFVLLQFGAIFGNFFSGIILHQYRNWHILFYAFGISGVSLAVLFVSSFWIRFLIRH